ncbi:HU family DNA-binding protein [uncultured Alistipes sp.]|uniref:HU family DNA-binding protein n=1 Tax=uncultured Alistipes sp. TaxID=538949 RepID=UPI00259B1016|nr:HU family DNA-binding protein [uncultured Alistipes sp.]
MNKTELVKVVAAGSGLSLTDASRAVGATIETITKSMKAGEPVVLPGFGSFTVRERAARSGRNPRTGEAITIAARRRVYFHPGKGLDLTGNKTAK